MCPFCAFYCLLLQASISGNLGDHSPELLCGFERRVASFLAEPRFDRGGQATTAASRGAELPSNMSSPSGSMARAGPLRSKRERDIPEAAIAYYRVSTKQQHRSGLGIEAQRAAVERFAEAEGLKIIAEYVEAETGRGADASTVARSLPPLSRQLAVPAASVLVSKLDQLSRDVAFVSGLMAQLPIGPREVKARIASHAK